MGAYEDAHPLPPHAHYGRNKWTGLTDYTQIVYEKGWDPAEIALRQNTHIVINVVRPERGDSEDAFTSWGSASRFKVVDNTPEKQQRTEPTFETGYTTGGGASPEPREDDPDDPDEPPDPNRPPVRVFHWRELGRTEDEVRIENPEDSSQYVMVRRVTAILFRTPDGNMVQLDLYPPG